MNTIKLEVPEKSCSGCKYLRQTVIDHNYYGEIDIKYSCPIFDKPIQNFKRCSECLACSEEYEHGIRKYADFLVEKINGISTEMYNNAVTEICDILKGCVTRPEVVEKISETLKKRTDS